MSDTKEPPPPSILQPSPLLDELDKAAWFPNWVTDEIQRGDDDPLLHAICAIPTSRRTNFKRKLETLLIEEQLDMKDEEREEFIKRLKTPLNERVCSLHFRGNGISVTRTFSNENMAAYQLSIWLQKECVNEVSYYDDNSDRQQIFPPYDVSKCNQILQIEDLSCLKFIKSIYHDIDLSISKHVQNENIDIDFNSESFCHDIDETSDS
jgi:hypothetical protein